MPVTFFFSNVYQSNVKQRPFAKGDIHPSFLPGFNISKTFEHTIYLWQTYD